MLFDACHKRGILHSHYNLCFQVTKFATLNLLTKDNGLSVYKCMIKVYRNVDMQRRLCDELHKMQANAEKKSNIFLTKVTHQELLSDVKKAKITTKEETQNY